MLLTSIRSWIWNTTEHVEAFVVACWTVPTGLALIYKIGLESTLLEKSLETKATDRLVLEVKCRKKVHCQNTYRAYFKIIMPNRRAISNLAILIGFLKVIAATNAHILVFLDFLVQTRIDQQNASQALFDYDKAWYD